MCAKSCGREGDRDKLQIPGHSVAHAALAWRSAEIGALSARRTPRQVKSDDPDKVMDRIELLDTSAVIGLLRMRAFENRDVERYTKGLFARSALDEISFAIRLPVMHFLAYRAFRLCHWI